MAWRRRAVRRGRRVLWCLGLVTLLTLVLPAPSQAQGLLELEPNVGSPGTSVTATVTGFEDCITIDGGPRAVFLWDGVQQVADAPVISGTAQASFDVPSDAAEGGHRVLVQCAGFEVVTSAAAFEVTAPEPALATIPDLRGRTVDEAEEMLAEQGLVLADTEQTDQPIADQDPPADTQVPEGTVVAVSFASSPEEPPSGPPLDTVPWWPWVVGGLAGVAAAATAARTLRRARKRRWIRDHVRVVPGRTPPGEIEVQTHVVEVTDR